VTGTLYTLSPTQPMIFSQLQYFLLPLSNTDIWYIIEKDDTEIFSKFKFE
jgi:hypothetical protein